MMSPTITRDYQPSDLEPVAELWFASWATTGLAFADGISVAGNAICEFQSKPAMYSDAKSAVVPR